MVSINGFSHMIIDHGRGRDNSGILSTAGRVTLRFVRHDVPVGVVSAKASLMIVLKVAMQRPQFGLQPRHL